MICNKKDQLILNIQYLGLLLKMVLYKIIWTKWILHYRKNKVQILDNQIDNMKKLNNISYENPVQKVFENNDLFKKIRDFNNPFRILLQEQNIKLPDIWIEFYDQCQRITKEELVEIPFGPIDWTVFSANDIIKYKDEWINESWVDIATKYYGMGHYFVMAILRNEDKCFFRVAGGANGYDRLANFQMFQNHDPYKEENKLYTICQGIEFIKDNNTNIDDYLQQGGQTKVNLNVINNH